MPPKTKAPTKKKDLAYQRVPVTDVILDDAEMPAHPLQRYDWVALADKAVRLAKSDPNKWQLVDDDGATSTASNITQGRVAALQTKRFVGWKFRGKCSEIRESETGGRRARVWIKAEPEELVL